MFPVSMKDQTNRKNVEHRRCPSSGRRRESMSNVARFDGRSDKQEECRASSISIKWKTKGKHVKRRRYRSKGTWGLTEIIVPVAFKCTVSAPESYLQSILSPCSIAQSLIMWWCYTEDPSLSTQNICVTLHRKGASDWCLAARNRSFFNVNTQRLNQWSHEFHPSWYTKLPSAFTRYLLDPTGICSIRLFSFAVDAQVLCKRDVTVLEATSLSWSHTGTKSACNQSMHKRERKAVDRSLLLARKEWGASKKTQPPDHANIWRRANRAMPYIQEKRLWISKFWNFFFPSLKDLQGNSFTTGNAVFVKTFFCLSSTCEIDRRAMLRFQNWSEKLDSQELHSFQTVRSSSRSLQPDSQKAPFCFHSTE